MDEQEFKRAADQSLDALYKRLTSAGDDAGFEADFNSGALSIEFENSAAKFVVSPNAPVRQIWVSAHSRSFKLDWNGTRGEFVLPDNGESLTQLIQQAIRKETGAEVTL
ncbi:MAG: iron donor protein CyaY [Acidobacteriota bacterium]|nr:iron donor protein CyaY [Acidobacteriota bacterium]